MGEGGVGGGGEGAFEVAGFLSMPYCVGQNTFCGWTRTGLGETVATRPHARGSKGQLSAVTPAPILLEMRQASEAHNALLALLRHSIFAAIAMKT